MTVWICTVVTFPAWLIEKSMVPSRLWSLTTVQHEESLQENQWLTYGILGWGNSHYDSKLPGMTMRDVHQLETFEEPATVAWKNGGLPSLKIGGSPKKDMNHLPSPLIFTKNVQFRELLFSSFPGREIFSEQQRLKNPWHDIPLYHTRWLLGISSIPINLGSISSPYIQQIIPGVLINPYHPWDWYIYLHENHKNQPSM